MRARLCIALLLTTIACSKPGPETATPEELCARDDARPERAGETPLQKKACVEFLKEMQKEKPVGFACTRRCLFANDKWEDNRQCAPLCSSDPDFVCPGIRQQAPNDTEEESAAKIETCRTRRKAFVLQKSPAAFQCVASCWAKATGGIPDIEACWTKNCSP